MAAVPKVPRGTLAVRTGGIVIRADQRQAIRDHDKTTARAILTAANSRPTRGSFDALLLDTGRVKTAIRPYLRAQCDFGSSVRVVSILSAFEPGDLLWVKDDKDASREKSSLLLDIKRVGVSRVMDMTDDQALNEGVATLPLRVRKRGTPRDWFAWLWDDIHGAGAWRRNDWVWIYEFRGIEAQVDGWLANHRQRAR